MSLPSISLIISAALFFSLLNIFHRLTSIPPYPSKRDRRYVSSVYLQDSSLSQDFATSSFFGVRSDAVANSFMDREGSGEKKDAMGMPTYSQKNCLGCKEGVSIFTDCFIFSIGVEEDADRTEKIVVNIPMKKGGRRVSNVGADGQVRSKDIIIYFYLHFLIVSLM